MNTCPKCTSPVQDTDLFCTVCGQKLQPIQATPTMEDTGHIEVPTDSYTDGSLDSINKEINNIPETPADDTNTSNTPPQSNYSNTNNINPNPNPAQNANNFNNNPNNGFNGQNVPPFNPYYNANNYTPVNNTPYIMWSVVLLCCCCLPLGIWSLVLAITAKNQPTYELAMKKLSTAKTVIIVGAIGGFILNMFLFFINFMNF